MKKFSKILCAVLMLALVCTSLAFLVSADSTPDVVQANPSNVDFGTATLGDVTGNNLPADASWSKYWQQSDPDGDGLYDGDDGVDIEDKTMLDRYLVTPNDGDAYGVFFAGQFQNGPSFQNVQNTYSYKGVELTENSYYVVDLDIATYTELITSLDISLPNRNVNPADNSGWNGFPFGQNVNIKQWIPNLGTEWTHLTVICSVKTNQQHIFVDGVYLGVTGAHAYNASQRTEGTVLKANGIKLEVAYEKSLNNTKMIYANESAAVDNVSRRDIVDADGIAALDALFASETPDITTWAGNVKGKEGSLPVLAEIDGVKYNSIKDINAALKGNVTKTVDILNNFPGRITVACDATVNMNGFTGDIITVEGGTITTDGDKITVDVPYIESITYTTTNNTNEFKAATIYNVAGSKWNGTNLVFFNGLDDTKEEKGGPLQGASLGIVTDNISGNSFAKIGPGDRNSNSYISITVNDTVKKSDENFYYVLDMDLAIYSDVTVLGWYAVCRGSSGCFGENIKSDTRFTAAVNSTNKGEFNHYTTILDFNNNKAYTYLNGKLISEVNNAVYGGNLSQFEAGFKFEQFRLFSSSEDNFAFDNISTRKVSDTTTLLQAMNANDLSLWSEYYADDEGYPVGITVPAIASVNGDLVYTEDQLADCLGGNAVKNVEIFASLNKEVTVNTNAIVNTNGLNASNLKAGEGVTTSTNGNVITFTAPWKPSATETTIKYADSIIASNVSGNLYIGRTGIDLKNNGNGHLAMYQVTDAETGNTYVKLQPTYSGRTETNIYLGTEILPAPSDSNAASVLPNSYGYYVHDFDIATDSTAIQAMTIESIARNNASENSTFPFGISYNINNYLTESTGEWMHVTIVGDYSTNNEYYFINGKLFAKSGYANQKYGEYEYLNLKGARINLSTNVWLDESETILLDNLSLRAYRSSSELATAIATGTLENWSENVTGMTGEKLPVIATIDGVGYSGTKPASEALTGDKNANIVLERDIAGKILLDCSATVTTNGFNSIKVNAQPAVYGEVVLASNFAIQGNKYIKITEDNYETYCAATEWYDYDATKDDPYGDCETIYFPIGTTVKYTGEMFDMLTNYIEGGKLYNTFWSTEEYEGETAVLVPVTEWPTVESTSDSFYFLYTKNVVDTDITITNDVKYNLSLYANFNVNVFVKNADGEHEIGGEKYALYTKSIAVNNLASDIEYVMTYERDGVTYTERFTVNVLKYATTVLNKADVSDQMKKVMMAALNYANEAYATVAGGENAEIAAILANPAYSAYTVETREDINPEYSGNFFSAITGVQLYLDDSVNVILKVANGFTGNLTIKYKDYKGSDVTHSFTVEEGQTYVVVEDIKAYNLDATMTIIANDVELGTYNLGCYIYECIQKGEDVDFVKALFTYAKVAKDYKTALNEAAK